MPDIMLQPSNHAGKLAEHKTYCKRILKSITGSDNVDELVEAVFYDGVPRVFVKNAQSKTIVIAREAFSRYNILDCLLIDDENNV